MEQTRNKAGATALDAAFYFSRLAPLGGGVSDGMPDIFISYKKEEREIANLLATRFTEAGYDVWWDDALLAGERFEDEISAVLDASRVVVVLWSRRSIASDWVKAEAETARQQNKALPAIIDDLAPAKLPLLYRGMHVARLTGWSGDPAHAGFSELIGSITDRLGAPAGPSLSEPQAEARLAQSVLIARQIKATKPRLPPRWFIIALAVILLAVAGTFAYTRFPHLSAAAQKALDSCATWAVSTNVDWSTGLPLLEGNVANDCLAASAALPNDGDQFGRLAIVRIEQGPSHSGEALNLATRGSGLKSALANYVFATMYLRGINVQRDAGLANTYFKTASDLGFARAAARLCLLAIDNGGTLPDGSTPEQIDTYCQMALDAGDAFGLMAEGYMQETGTHGGMVDHAGAAALYRRAAALGNVEASIKLGSLLERGLGVDRNQAEAASLYSTAANQGFPEALRRLAIAYELGSGVPANDGHAAQLYETASIRQDVVALMLAGYGIADQGAISAPIKREMERIAIDQSNPVGQRLLAQMQERGMQRPQDLPAAEKLLTQCADAGNSFCLQHLGYYYTYGLGGTADAARAVPLFEASAAKGNMFGQFWAGYCYDYGIGVPQDIDKAVGFYRLAAAFGHLTSINRLQQLGFPVSG